MYSDGSYHQTLGYLHIQFGNLDQACLDYLNAIEAFQRDDDQDAALQLTERLNDLNCEIESRSGQKKDLSLSVHLKIEILRLCRLGSRYSRRYQHPVALNVLERGLNLSDVLADIDYQQGQYCAAIVLGMMGKIYHTQRYYLFALASFKAALEAYESLSNPDKQTQGRMATVLCKIADIAEITHHPDVAIECYLDALWYLNACGQKPRARQVAQQLKTLCNMSQQPVAVKAD
ncbi:hypothetical protein N836_14615 [Leptolyngbya sp. Heron Island J]|uniref:hypothetical protein n=1 Tax=Leptolyngbya sp. Heron Island J TaxID=1385935 RepID=UPI0003B9D4BA|nr:hypothetical protein [Leptolyngbya sp. Heron Island J]ESA34990.1 hypothetical protein N836_14615 [Leptolyngbya sp. Heron Island J]